ncbi:MAG: Ryanodine receptor Ryr [Bacteroidaceae bacterium]|nr:Ryanodine receptor Ryr [Bacteroidaceae bacterium]
MKTNDYIPHPIDVSDIALSQELKSLTEKLAKNIHEVWAYNRVLQGWMLGEERNDKLKTHPSIKPYEDLSEEEKDYDRNTCINTIKLIIKLGFCIIKDH